MERKGMIVFLRDFQDVNSKFKVNYKIHGKISYLTNPDIVNILLDEILFS